MSENVSDAELEANSLQLFTAKGRWSSALWEWKGGEHPSPLFSLRGQSCLFGHTPAVILVWITAVCVCVCLSMKWDVVWWWAYKYLSLSGEHHASRRGGEKKKQRRRGTAEADNAVLRCVYSSVQMTPTSTSTKTWCAEDVWEEVFVICLFFLYFFCRIEQIPPRFDWEQN